MPNIDTVEPEELTFEQGYSRLQEIARRLGDDDVPVSEMCDLFAEGKGLETALTGFLDTQQARIESIEKGEGVRRFQIVTATAPRLSAEDDIPF
jgi:exodeoxyribonuclease VII small subunit